MSWVLILGGLKDSSSSDKGFRIDRNCSKNKPTQAKSYRESNDIIVELSGSIIKSCLGRVKLITIDISQGFVLSFL